MHNRGVAQQEGLEAEVLSDPGASGFAVLAELYRCDGRPADAEAVARAGLAVKPDAWEGRVVLALSLLDRGLELDARTELERVVRESAALQGISLDDFRDEPFDDLDLVAEAASGAAQGDAESVPVVGAFATETMAGLLERQGDREGALRIRASLEAAVEDASGPRAHVIEELERWLSNAQRRMGERA